MAGVRVINKLSTFVSPLQALKEFADYLDSHNVPEPSRVRWTGQSDHDVTNNVVNARMDAAEASEHTELDTADLQWTMVDKENDSIVGKAPTRIMARRFASLLNADRAPSAPKVIVRKAA